MHTDLLSHVATLMELKGESAWRRPSCSFTSCSRTSGSVCGRVIDEFISIRIQAYYSAVWLLKRRSSSTETGTAQAYSTRTNCLVVLASFRRILLFSSISLTRRLTVC